MASESNENHQHWEKRVKNSNSIAPHFEEESGSLSTDYWDDWLRVLLEQNKERMSVVDDDFMDYLTLGTVEYIFTICVRMRLPSDVRYLAALYFDKFMRRQSRSLFKFISNNAATVFKKDEEWMKVEANLSRQIALRACSCIQLASKEFQYHTSLSAKDIVSMMRSLGQAYTMKAVCKSEIRIVRTLSFSLPKSPLTYPETFLKALSCVPIDTLGIKTELLTSMIWDHVLLLLDMFFLYNETFVGYLISNMNRYVDIEAIPNSNIACIKADYILLGVSIVVTATAIVHDEDTGDRVNKMLGKMAGTSSEEVLEFLLAFHKLIENKQPIAEE